MIGIAAKWWSAVAGGDASPQQQQSSASVSEPGTVDTSVKTSLTAVCVATLAGHEDRVWSVAWHPTLPLLASCGGDKTARVWQCNITTDGLTSWSQVALVEGEHQRTIRHVEWSSNGAFLSCASFDATVSLWALKTTGSSGVEGSLRVELSLVAMLEGHENEVKNCRWAPQQSCMLATCSRDKTVWVWEREATGDDESADDDLDFECGGVLSGHSQDVKSVNWLPKETAPSGRLSLLSCSYDSTIKLWEENPRRKDDWYCAQTLIHGALGTVWEVAIRPHAQKTTLAAATESGTLRLWYPNSNGMFQSCGDASISPGAPVFSIDWDPSGRFVVAGCGDNSITILCLNEVESTSESNTDSPYAWQQLGKIRQAHTSDVNCVRFAQSSTLQSVRGGENEVIHGWFASCGDDDVVRIWKLQSAAQQSNRVV